jgi:hypothetical protein
MNDSMPDYGCWPLVIINSLVFIIFAFSFAKRGTRATSTLSSLFMIGYAAHTPGFVPRLGPTWVHRQQQPAAGEHSLNKETRPFLQRVCDARLMVGRAPYFKEMRYVG